jgi:hypothetical protein
MACIRWSSGLCWRLAPVEQEGAREQSVIYWQQQGFPVKARKRLLSVNRYDILRAGSPLLSDIFIYFQTKYFQTK